MTNAEKYLKDNVNVKEFAVDLARYFQIHDTYTRTYLGIINGYLNKKTKPTLTEDERVILRNINNMCKTIYREKYTGHIRTTLHCLQPDGLCGEELRCFDNLFQSIKERRRILY